MIEDIKAIENSYFIGDGEEFDKTSLRAYKCEKELKKAVKEREPFINGFLYGMFNIKDTVTVKVSEPKEEPVYETFTTTELIDSKLTGLNPSLTINIYEIYKEKGIEEAIINLHNLSSLTIV